MRLFLWLMATAVLVITAVQGVDIQFGVINSVGLSSQVVNFDGTISNPLVFANLISENDPNFHGTPRVSNVVAGTGSGPGQEGSFTIQMSKPQFPSSPSTVSEQVYWIVIKEGNYFGSGALIGKHMEARKISGVNTVRNDWKTVTYTNSPVGLPMVIMDFQTWNEANQMKVIRLNGYSVNSFDYAGDYPEQERVGSGYGSNDAEDVAWLMIEAGTSNSDLGGVNVILDVVTTSRSVNNNPYTVTFPGIASELGLRAVYGMLETTYGGDTAWLRRDGIVDNTCQFFVEEEIADGETFHTTENIGVMAVSCANLAVTAGVQQGPFEGSQMSNICPFLYFTTVPGLLPWVEFTVTTNSGTPPKVYLQNLVPATGSNFAVKDESETSPAVLVLETPDTTLVYLGVLNDPAAASQYLVDVRLPTVTPMNLFSPLSPTTDNHWFNARFSTTVAYERIEIVVTPSNGPVTIYHKRESVATINNNDGSTTVENGGVYTATILSPLINTEYYFGVRSNSAVNPLSVILQTGPPELTSVSPNTGPTIGRSITLQGSNFGTSGSTISFGGVNCPNIVASGTTATCDAPASEGIVAVTLTHQGKTSNALNYTHEIPEITSVTAASGLPTLGNVVIALSGNNFGAFGTGTVTIDGEPCTDVTSYTQGSLECTAPAGSGDAQVVLTVATRTSLPATVAYSSPIVTGIYPATGPTLGTTLITILGVNFGPPGIVVAPQINSVACTYVSHNQTAAVCQLPAGTGSGLSVRITVDGKESGVSSVTFSYDKPTITSVTPRNATTRGAVITIRGSNFGPGTASVDVGSSDCPVQGSHTDSYIECLVGVGDGTDLAVKVTQNGLTSTESIAFDYLPPNITEVIPRTNQNTRGGEPVTLIGSSFGLTGVVLANLLNPTVISHDHEKIVYTSDVGAGLNREVTVRVGGQTSNVALFNYATPSLHYISPTSGSTQGTYTLTVFGENFGPAPTVQIGILTCASPAVDANHVQVTCLVPQGQGTNFAVTVTSTSGVSNSTRFDYAPPVITSINPLNGPTGGSTPTAINIQGRNFGLSGAVLVNGNPCTSSTYSHELIVCSLPSGRGKNAHLNVTVSGQVATNFSFSYNSPQVTGISPKRSTNGEQYISIVGTSFDTAGSVTVNGLPCPLGAIGGYGQELITCLVPAGQGTVDVVVTSVIGLASPPFPYQYLQPSITSVTGSSFPTAGGSLIVVNGNSFGKTAYVLVNNRNCTTSTQTDFVIQCFLPEGQGKNQPVTVEVSSQVSAPNSLDYARPGITGILKQTAPTSGGVNVTIVGTNFGVFGEVSVLFGISPCLPSKQNHTHIICDLPPGQGTETVRVTVSQQQSDDFLFAYDGPLIISVSPSVGPTDGNAHIYIHGESLGSSGSVLIGGQLCTTISHNDTDVVCKLGVGSGINKPVKITTGGVESNDDKLFSYLPPTISSVSPPNATTEGAVELQLSGNNFGTSGTVLIGGKTCGPLTHTHNLVTCTIPAGEGVNLDVTVEVGEQLSNAVNFSYNAPEITGVGPSGAPTSGTGFVLTVDGANFGSTGQVFVGTQQCSVSPASFYQQKQIKCNMPAGVGTLDVTVTTASGTSNKVSYTYAPPTIIEVTPTFGPTAGLPLIIRGTNLGIDAASVQIGSFVCSGTNTHTTIECTLAAGGGRNLLVAATVGGQTSQEAVYFSYDPPTVTSISPNIVNSTGNVNVTLSGTNLGAAPGVAINVTVGDSGALPIFYHAHGSLTTTIPPGVGKDLPVRVVVQDQHSVVQNIFSYRKPVVTSIYTDTCIGCCVSLGNTVVDCPTAGGISLTITGYNFGANGANVTVDANHCAFPTHDPVTPDSKITCVLPRGLGFDLPVTLTTGGQQSNSLLLAYSGPTFFESSLRLLEDVNNPGTTSLVLNSTTGGQKVLLNGKFLKLGSVTPVVKYGLATSSFDDLEYTCTVDEGLTNSTHLYCDMQAGTGVNLTFQVYDSEQYSRRSVDSVSYPRPIIIPNTIRDSVDGNGTTKVAGSESEGEIVYFDVQYIRKPDSTVKVYYAQADPFVTECTQVTVTQKEDEIYIVRCKTQPGDGTNYRFQVQALNQRSEPGTDIYSYPVSPKVHRVSGCTDVQNATVNCPTSGGLPLIIYGLDFSKSVSVKIGTADCLNVDKKSSSEIHCILPEGAGLLTPVLVLSGQLFSRSVSLLSYAVPTPYVITGCPGTNGNGTTECDRYGGTQVTVTGGNLGASNAIVLIGGSQCTNVVHDSLTPHEKLTCSTPPGVLLNSAVLLIQDGGEISSTSLFLSYKQCEKGTYDASTTLVKDLACTNCTVGRFSNALGQASCSPCEDGEYTAVNSSTSCTKCDKGTYSVRVSSVQGASKCEDCVTGTFNPSLGQRECVDCPPGSFTNTSRQTECTLCATGYSQKDSGLTKCSICSAGSFAFARGSLLCTFCSAGTYAPVDGLSSCLDCPRGRAFSGSGAGAAGCTKCPKGTAIGSLGQAACLPCGDGTFANDTELTACLTCPAGKFSKQVSATVGATICTDCDVGTYVPTGGQGVCLSCPKGEFNGLKGQSACEKCAPGQHTDNLERQIKCTNCSTGFIARDAGTAVCSPCSKGSYAPVEGLSICTLCEAGRHQELDGKSTCEKCPTGRGNPSTGQVVCPACLPGEFTNVTGKTACERCPPGYKSATSALTICEACEKGTFGAADGQAACKDCNEGFIAPVRAMTACVACLPGSIAATTALSICTNCTAGKFSAATGGDFCFSCPKGAYSGADGASTCDNCPAGTEQPASDKSFCDECKKGFISASSGQPTCTKCDQGRFANLTRLTSCFECPSGRSQPIEGQSFCGNCDKGYFTAARAQANCEACTFGKFGPTTGLTVCESCPKGKFIDGVAKDACTNCTKGTFADNVGLFQCKECPIGTFNNEGGLSTCTPCDTGYHQPDTKQTVCTICPEGRFQAGTGQSVCIDCDIGTFQDEKGKSFCKSCALGKVTATSKLTVCTNCTAGTFRGAGSSSLGVCEPCPPGFYSGAPGAASCDPCPIGQRQDESGKSFCRLCDLGHANGATGQKVCGVCPGGRYADELGLTECKTCQAGNFSLSQASACSRCAQGKFSNVAGLSSCANCPTGSANNLRGQTGCELCLPGKFAQSEVSFTCTNCSTGTAVGSSGASTCPPCSKGTFAPTTGSTTCTPCERGTFQSFDQQSKCEQCERGSFTSSSGQANCLKCDIGTFAAGKGLTICEPCAAGTVQPQPGQDKCLDCVAGKAIGAKGQGVCEDCDSGFYSNATGFTKCLACDAGKASTKSDTNGATVCSKCELGKFIGATGQPFCLNCPFGTFANVTGRSACADCAPGRKADFEAAQECTDCDQGSFSSTGGPACLLCGAGTYAPNFGQTVCTNCPEGRFETRSGSEDCFLCSAGSFMSAQGAVQCDFCGAGTFSNSTEQSFCYECQPGQYQDNSNSTSCKPCQKGKATPSVRQKACQDCPVGKFMDIVGQLVCKDCPPGSYQDEIGKTECKPCQTGRFLANGGLSACLFCDAGTFSNDTGFTECFDCPAGSVQPENGQDKCVLCPPGSFQNSPKQLACIACTPGSFTAVNGSVICEECQPGEFQARSSQTRCENCTAGSFNTAARRSSCTDCEPGTAQPLNGTTFCSNCLEGQFQGLPGKTSCDPCPVRTFNGVPGQSVCVSCQPGTFGNVSGLLECTPCPVGRVQPSSRQSVCQDCEPGSFMNAPRQQKCTPCSPGTFGNVSRLTICEQCAFGKAQGVEGRSFCNECERGKFANSRAAQQCTNCRAGRYTNFTGQEDCKDCARGYFQSLEGRVSCNPCPPGRASPSLQTTLCDICGVGTFAGAANVDSSGGRTVCSDCPPGRFNDVEERSTCTNCSAGTAQLNSGRTRCLDCTAGKFQSIIGQQQCNFCPVGFRSVIESASQSCVICPAGKTSRVTNKDTLGHTCEACSGNAVSRKPGQGQCISCQLNAVANEEGTSCLCDVGTYAAPVAGSNSLFTCETCPTGASCDEVGVTQSNIKTDCGFWREDNTTLVFHRCIVPAHCPCGQEATAAASGCSGNRTGPLCSLCPPGYTASTITSPCELCPSRDTAIAASVLISITLMLALVFMYWLVLRMDRGLMREAKRMAEWKKEHDWAWFEDDEDNLNEAQKGKKFNLYDKDGAMSGIVTGPQAKPNFTYKMKILLGFFQISVNLAVVLDIPWPSLFQSFIVKFDIVNFNFLRLSNADCVVETNFYNRMMIVGFTPMIVGALVFVFFLMPMLVKNAREVDLDYDLRSAAMQRSKKKFWKLFLFSLFLIYPGVSSTVLRIFVCREINGRTYLLADMNKECYDSDWDKFASIAVIFILVYPIGIPAFFYYMLSKNKKRLLLPDVRVQLGFLYEAYHTSLWWFELVDMMNKLFLTSILAFVPVNTQMPMGLSWSVGYVCVLLLIHPYVRKGDDFLHLLAQTEIFLFLLAGYFFLENPEFDETTDIAMSIMLILLVSSIVLLFLWQIGRVLKSVWEDWQEERERKKQLEDEDEDMDADLEGEALEEDDTAETNETLDIRNMRLPAGALMTRNPLFSSEPVLNAEDSASDTPSDVSSDGEEGPGEGENASNKPIGEAVIADLDALPSAAPKRNVIRAVVEADEDPWGGEDEDKLVVPGGESSVHAESSQAAADESSEEDADEFAVEFAARHQRKR